MRKSPILLLIVLSLTACRNEISKNKYIIHNENTSKVEPYSSDIVLSEIDSQTSTPAQKNISKKSHIDSVLFKEFNDDGDYSLFIVSKGIQEITLIYKDDMLNRNDFVRGDNVRIVWELDSIRNPSDEEVLVFIKRLRKADKIKDGKVSLFRKENNKEITYVSNITGDSYSDSFINYVHTIVEYVVANSKSETLKEVLNSPEATLFYAITEIEKANRMYYVFHISSKMDGQLKDIQQLYQDVERGALYEYDAVTDSLIAVD